MTRNRPTFLAHPGVNARCRMCKGDSYEVTRSGELAVAALCSCVGECPVCRGAKFVARPDGYRTRCQCTGMIERIRRFNFARIPARHAASSLVTFNKRNTSLTQAVAAVTTYIRGYRPGQDNRGLVFVGEVGRGKTHLMVAMLRDLVFKHGVSARFVEFSHLLADLKTSFDRGSGTSEILDPLAHVDVLAIDELGKGRNTEWEGTVLDELVSRRYNAAATILGTTNFAPGAATGIPVGNLANAEKGSLSDRVSPRVYSRIEEMCDFILLESGDYRQRLHIDRHR